MFLYKPGSTSRVSPRRWRCRADDDVDDATLRDSEHSEPQPAAKIPEARITLPSIAARRDPGRQPNLIAGRSPIDGLKDELEIVSQLQLTNHNERGLVVSQRDEIAAADFTLDREPEAFKKLFDGQVKCSLQDKLSGEGFSLSSRGNHKCSHRLCLRGTPQVNRGQVQHI